MIHGEFEFDGFYVTKFSPENFTFSDDRTITNFGLISITCRNFCGFRYCGGILPRISIAILTIFGNFFAIEKIEQRNFQWNLIRTVKNDVHGYVHKFRLWTLSNLQLTCTFEKPKEIKSIWIATFRQKRSNIFVTREFIEQKSKFYKKMVLRWASWSPWCPPILEWFTQDSIAMVK